MNPRLLLAAFILAGCLSLPAAETGPDTVAPPALTAPVTDPSQVSAHFREVASRPEYHEIPEVDIGSRLKDTLSLWFLHLGNKFGQFQYSGEMPAFASLLMTLLVMASIACLLYVMVRLTRRRAGMEISLTTSDPGPRTFHPPEFYDDEIQRALRESDWHSAWLASWRQFLSRLENRHLVEADRTRTNREYLAQLRAHSLPSPALNLLVGMVDAYDRTIYGRRPVAQPDWDQFHGQIAEATLLLNLDDRPVTGHSKGHPA